MSVMKKFLKILTTALGSLMVVCPQFDVYGMETTIKNKGLSLEDQIKESELFIGREPANRYIAKDETKHVATAVAVSILGENHDNDFLQSLNATYDEYTKEGRNNDFRRIMGLLNAWIGTESVNIFKNEFISNFSRLALFTPDLTTIYKKSVDYVWNALTNNNNRSWGDIVMNRFNEVFPDKRQVLDSDKSIAERYFFNDWNLRFVKSQILSNFVLPKILEQQKTFNQTMSTRVDLPNDNMPDLKTELINTTVKEMDNSLPGNGQSNAALNSARISNKIVQQACNNALSNYLKKKKLNIHKFSTKKYSQKVDPIHNKPDIEKEDIFEKVCENAVVPTLSAIYTSRKSTQRPNNKKLLDSKFSQVSDKEGEGKSIKNNKNNDIAFKDKGIANSVSALDNNVSESNSNSDTVPGKLKVEEGNSKGFPPPPPPPANIPGPVKSIITEADRVEVLKNIDKIADAKKKDEDPKNTNNTKTEGAKRVVSSNPGSQNNGKKEPKVQIASANMQDLIAAARLRMKNGKREAQPNLKNDQTKNTVNSNNVVLPELRNKGVGKGVKIDYTKEGSVKNIWNAYEAVCVQSTKGSGNMTCLIQSKGATSGFSHLDEKSILIKDPRTGLDSICKTAALLSIREFENLEIFNKYSVDENDNIVNFDSIFKQLDRKAFARVQLYYILKYVNSQGKIQILTGDFEKDKLNNKRVKKYNTKDVFLDCNLLKKVLIPVFSYQTQKTSDTFSSIKFIGFKEYDGVNFENFNVATDSKLLGEDVKQNVDLARRQLYVIINTLFYKQFNEKWFDNKSE